MTQRRAGEAEPSVPELVREIAADAETLVEQQLALLRSEVRQELDRLGGAAFELGVGAGLATTGGLLSALAVVHGLQRATRLPLWGCFGLVGSLLGAAGAGLMTAGARRVSRVRLVPPQTTAALRENLSWAKEQLP